MSFEREVVQVGSIVEEKVDGATENVYKFMKYVARKRMRFSKGSPARQDCALCSRFQPHLFHHICTLLYCTGLSVMHSTSVRHLVVFTVDHVIMVYICAVAKSPIVAFVWGDRCTRIYPQRHHRM